MGVLPPGPLRSLKPHVHTPQQFWGSPSIHHAGWWIRQGSYSQDAQVVADTSQINMAWQRKGTSRNSEQAILLHSVPRHPPPQPLCLSLAPGESPQGFCCAPAGMKRGPRAAMLWAFYPRLILCRGTSRELGRAYFLTNSPTPKVFAYFLFLICIIGGISVHFSPSKDPVKIKWWVTLKAPGKQMQVEGSKRKQDWGFPAGTVIFTKDILAQ